MMAVDSAAPADRFESIARVAHAALDAYRVELGETPHGSFEQIPAEHRDALRDAVRLALRGATSRRLYELGVVQLDPTRPPRGELADYARAPEVEKKKAALLQAVTQSLGCGVERWDVKTGTDPLAATVNMVPKLATIAELAAYPAPPPDPPTRVQGGPEFQVYELTAMITAVKEEADSDYHLALSDGQGNTMIAEIPCPGCCGSSPWSPLIAQARQATEQALAAAGVSQIGPEYSDVSVQATITGVGFFDRIHGQRGVAPNGIELHPVLGISFDKGGAG